LTGDTNRTELRIGTEQERLNEPRAGLVPVWLLPARSAGRSCRAEPLALLGGSLVVGGVGQSCRNTDGVY